MSKTKVACLLGDGFEESEFRVPFDAMRRAGLDVEIIGTAAGEEITGKSGQEKVKASTSIDQARPESYGALFIPGGYSPDHLRADARFVDFVRDFDALKRPVASICHGAQLLMSARLVQGRTLTAWKTVQGDLELAGAHVRDEPVVTDGNWITSRQPSDLEAFSSTVVRALS